MPANYTNSPLIEVLCEFHFEPTQNWDWTIPGLMYGHVRDQFPVKQEQQSISFGVAGGQPVPPTNPSVSRIQFLRQDRSALIQIAPHFFGINHLRPYPGWEAFRDIVFKNLDHYAESAQPNNVVRVELRYINKIDVPTVATDGALDLSDYLQALPGIPQALLHNSIQRFIQRVEIGIDDAHGVLILQSGTLPPEREGHAPFLLDLACVTIYEKPFSLERARQWITRAHTEIEHAFEACIGDQARILFGDKQHG